MQNADYFMAEGAVYSGLLFVEAMRKVEVLSYVISTRNSSESNLRGQL